MGYIYEAMNRAKDAIVRSFNGNEEKYKEIFNIIDKRWEIQLHRPLHAAGYFLNPEFFYDKPEIEHDAEIMSDLYKCILRLTRGPTKQEKVVAEVSLFTNAQGLFGNELAVKTRKTRAPAEWWAAYGASAPNLQKFAMEVLNLTCSASGKSGDKGKGKELNLTQVHEDEELDEIGRLDSENFATIDTLDKDDDDIGDDDLS
ncbi:uncharacterized protein LOC117910701 [Vitis riparia]|uniref:uncharacterized protein LOC117910701 n=1 Tax=Vitis riparia TaxID=96939 RepID=UPI00155AE296|nr:uncharacterized protein LOC117910701 [Vitis riparia]